MSRLKQAENRLTKFQNDLVKLSKKHGVILREIGGYYIIKEDDKPLIKNLSYSKSLDYIDKKNYERSSFFVCQEIEQECNYDESKYYDFFQRLCNYDKSSDTYGF